MKKRLVMTTLGAAAFALLAGCTGEKKPHEGGARPAAPAAVSGLVLAAVAAEEVGLTRELAGSVQATSVSNVSARLMAQVTAVTVAEGDHVRAGQPLVQLDGRELQEKVRQAESAQRQAEGAVAQARAGVRQAQAQLELAAASHTRYRALLDGRAVSRQEYEHVAAQETMAREAVSQAESGVARAEGAVAQAASAVAEARTWLAFTTITAPVAGRVTAKRIEPGSMAVPGMPLVTIEQEGRYRLELPVDGALSGTIVKGAPLAVSVEAAGLEATVPVTDVVPTADPVSRTFIVKADLPADPRLRSGQYARVRVALGARAALVVPEEALVKRGQLDGVFVATDGTLAFRIVQAGRPTGPGKREILSGLSAGEQIVVAGVERAVDGAPVASAEAR